VVSLRCPGQAVIQATAKDTDGGLTFPSGGPMRHFHRLTLCASQVVAAALVSSTLAATDTSSANYVMPGCRDFISSNSLTPAYPFVQGFCAGVIQSLIYDSHDICLPSGVEKGSGSTPCCPIHRQSTGSVARKTSMRWRLKPCVRHGHANGETSCPIVLC
jgi:hypothetical protein